MINFIRRCRLSLFSLFLFVVSFVDSFVVCFFLFLAILLACFLGALTGYPDLRYVHILKSGPVAVPYMKDCGDRLTGLWCLFCPTVVMTTGLRSPSTLVLVRALLNLGHTKSLPHVCQSSTGCFWAYLTSTPSLLPISPDTGSEESYISGARSASPVV